MIVNCCSRNARNGLLRHVSVKNTIQQASQ